MSRFYQLVIFSLSLALCVFGPAQARAAAVWPDGVGASGVAGGVYPGADAGSCCWTAPSARLRLTVPEGADTLVISVFVPRYAVRGDAQGLRVQIGRAAPQERCCFGPGEHDLAFALGQPGNSRVVTVTLRTRSTFVPATEGFNGDTRRLGVLLRGVAFENSLSGTRIDAAGGWMHDRRIDSALLALAALLIGFAVYRRPIAATVALIVTDPFLLTYSIHGTTLTLPKVALVASGAALLARSIRRSQPLPAPALWLLLGAQVLEVASMLLSSLHAGSHGAALRETLKAVQYALTLGVAYWAYRMEPDERALRVAVAGIAVLVAGLALAQEFTHAPSGTYLSGYDVPRIAGPLEGPNQLAAFLGIAVPVMLAFAITRTPLLLERIAIGAGVLACVLTLSRGGIAALALGCAVMFALRYRAQSARAIGLAVAALFAIVLGLAFGEFAGVLHGGAMKIFGASGDAYNGGLGSRPDLWHAAYTMWRAHPLIGVGPGNFELLVGRFDPGVHTHANGMYFQTLAEQGLLGLLALAAVIAASVAPFARRLREPLVLGACIAAIVLAFHQIVDCLWLYPKVGVFWWVVLAAGAACVDAAREASNAETAADFTTSSSSCSIA